VDGLGFTWPNSPNGRPDNVSAAGPDRSNSPQPASTLSFVGSAVNGNQQTKATVTYTDGSTDAIDLSFTDWTVGGGTGTVQYGNEIVARTDVPQCRGCGQGSGRHVCVRDEAVRGTTRARPSRA
jgi:hypothetical protein